MLKWRDFIYYIHADPEIFSPNFCHQNKMISILKISDTQKHQNFVMTATKYCNISIQTIYKTIFLKNFDLHFPLCVQFILKAEGRGQSYTADILRKYFSLQKSQETNRGHQLLQKSSTNKHYIWIFQLRSPLRILSLESEVGGMYLVLYKLRICKF